MKISLAPPEPKKKTVYISSGKMPDFRKDPPNVLLPYIRRWCNNNGRDDLGICRFIFDLKYLTEQLGWFPILTDFKLQYGVAPWARDALDMYYTYEEGMTVEDRTYAIQTYRGGSKSFWFAFVSTIYEITVGQYGIFYQGTMLPEYNYQILRAKTGKEAKKRLMNISNFLNTKIIQYFFGDLKPSFADVKLKEGKDTGELLILKNKYIIEASGIDQPSRGMNIFQIRPKKICHAKGTRIWQNGRLIPIEDSKNIILDTHFEQTKIVKVWGLPLSESVTKDHLYWTMRRKKISSRNWIMEEPSWQMAKYLTKDDYIGMPIEYKKTQPQPILFSGGKEIIKRDDKGHIIEYKYKKEKISKVPYFFYLPDWWWAYGLWLGDGGIGNGKYLIWTCTKEKPEVIERLKVFIESCGRTPTIYDLGNYCDIKMSYKDLAEWMIRHKEGNSIKNPPEWIYHLDDIYLKQIARGYIDSDGYITDKSIRITSVNLEGLYRFSNMLARVGVCSSIRNSASARMYHHKNGKIYFCRKKWELYIKEDVGKLGYDIVSSYPKTTRDFFIKDGWLWRRVKSVVNGGVREIQPITTTTGTYTTVFGLSHNCFDDVQNRENTKTPGRREQCDKEVMEESFPAVADDGVMVYIFNRVHEDDTGSKLMDPKNDQWKKQSHTFTVKIIDGVKYPGIGDLENEVPEWPRRWTIERIRKMRDWWIKQPKLGGMRGWLKEKYNIIKSEAEYEIKYYDAKYLRAFGQNWLVFDDREYVNVDIAIGCDPAISENKNSSDAVIVAVAYTPDRRRFVLEMSSGKYDINDRFYDINYVPRNGVIALDDEVAFIRRRGCTGEIIRMAIKYHAYGASIETAGQQGTFFNEFCNAVDKMAISIIKFPYKGGQDKKSEKNKECPLGYFELGLYHIKADMVKLKAEIDAFPFTKQDHLDSIRIAEQIARYPAKIEYNPLGLKKTSDAFEPNEPALTYTEQKGNRTRSFESWVATP